MTTAQILERLADYGDEPLLKADGFDDALIGLAHGWFEQSQSFTLAYDYRRCVEILRAQGMPEDDAIEYLEFNTLGAYLGPCTPVFIDNWRT